MKPDHGPYSHGPAGRERWAYLVLGAVRGLCLADGNEGPDATTAQEILDATYDEAQAMIAIRRAAEAIKFDRATAALRSLRDTNRMAGRPAGGAGVGHARATLQGKKEST